MQSLRSPFCQAPYPRAYDSSWRLRRVVGVIVPRCACVVSCGTPPFGVGGCPSAALPYKGFGHAVPRVQAIGMVWSEHLLAVGALAGESAVARMFRNPGGPCPG